MRLLKLFFFILIIIVISFCKKQNIQTPKQEQTKTFQIIQEYEKPYTAHNVKRIDKLTIESAVNIYIQHLKEQLDWNKRINYEINKKKYQDKDKQTTGQANISGEYGSIFNEMKEKYEKIFFEKIGIPREKWEEFSSKYYQEILNYRKANPQIENEILKYSKLIQKEQRILDENDE